jgi:site-specific recombinase XerD
LVAGVPHDETIFRNARGAPLTRDGVAYLLRKYVRQAAETSPTLRGRRVTPHVLRHSCAVALLQAGVDLTVIRDYLGHVSVETTNRYVTTNLRMKRDVLEAFWKRAGLEKGRTAGACPSPKLLAFLESL